MELGNKHGLKDYRRENRSMMIADLKVQIETTLCTTEKALKLGELCVSAVLYLPPPCSSGRPACVYFKVALRRYTRPFVRDSNEGPHQLPRWL